MTIGLIDVDGHNFPNLALMKLSAWHKAQGTGRHGGMVVGMGAIRPGVYEQGL